MKVTRMVWARQARKFIQDGWWVEGGIWPWLRIVRPMPWGFFSPRPRKWE